LNFKLWDLNTTTTADFSILVRFDENVWENWQNYKIIHHNPRLSFKMFIAKEMKEQL
jgi:hypothetical protein